MKIRQYYIDLITNKFYDYWLGIESCTQVYPYDMSVASNNIIHATRYQGCHVSVFRKVMAALPRHYLNHHFIDFGHGKGRAIILAAKYGLKKLTGIEFASDLYKISERNWNSFEARFNTGAECNLIYSDAVDFTPTTSKNIYFFFNPFRDKVMSEILEKIIANSPSICDDLFVFVNPRNHFLYDLFGMKLFYQIDSSDPNRVVRFYRVTDSSPL